MSKDSLDLRLCAWVFLCVFRTSKPETDEIEKS